MNIYLRINKKPPTKRTPKPGLSSSPLSVPFPSREIIAKRV